LGEAKYRRRGGLQFRREGGDIVVFCPDTGDFCVLNETAAFVFEAIDRRRTLEHLCKQLATEYGVDASAVREDVRACLREMVNLGWVERSRRAKPPKGSR